jgi:CHAD domain-containing protein
MMAAHRLTEAMDEQVRRFTRALGRARRGEPRGVHQARVASRRIREILPLVETWELEDEDDPPRRPRRKDVRRIAAALGAVRELDVTVGVLTSSAIAYAWMPEIVDEVRAGLEADRVKRLEELLDAIEHVGARTFLHDLRRSTAGKAPDRATLNQAMTARRQSRAALLAATLQALGTLYVPDRLHAVRLAAKKLRYSLETQRAVRRSAVARDIRVLAGMQEQLGHLHDLQILQDRLRAIPRQAAATELRRMIADLELECRALHARVMTKVQSWLQMADRLSEG